MYTYVQRPGCKKENTATYVYIRAGSQTPTRAYIRTTRARVLGRNGETASSSCSWGGNGMRRVHGEATKCIVFIGRRRNEWEPTGGVRTECVVVFIGRAWTEQAMETRPGVPQNGGNSLVFDRPRSKQDPVHREGSGVPQNGGNRLVLERLRSKRGHVHPPSTTSLQPPRATVHPPSTSSGVHL